MVEIKRLSEQDIYNNFQKLRDLIGRATKRGGGNTDDYTRLMINSIVNPHVLAGGVFQDGKLQGLFLAISGMSYFAPDIAAYLVLLSLENAVSTKDIYEQAMSVIKQWMKEVGATTLIGSSPRRGFARLAPSIDNNWKVHQILVWKISEQREA